MRILCIALKHASITHDWLKISGVRSWGLSGRGAVWRQDGKKNIDFDNLFSVSRRFKRVDGRQSQRKDEDAFLRGAPGENQVHTSFKIFQRPFKVLQNTF